MGKTVLGKSAWIFIIHMYSNIQSVCRFCSARDVHNAINFFPSHLLMTEVEISTWMHCSYFYTDQYFFR